MAIIDPDDLTELDDDFIASVMEDEPQEIRITDRRMLREEEPEPQEYDEYELPEQQEGDE